ncbi:MAG: potassium channel family protein [Caldilineaceae bacterium]
MNEKLPSVDAFGPIEPDPDAAVTDTPESIALREQHATYELFILLVTLISLLINLMRLVTNFPPQVDQVLVRIDGVYALILLLDFFLRFFRAPGKVRYMLGLGVFDLLGSIPGVVGLRFLRLPRVVWQLRLLRRRTPRGVLLAARRQLAQSTLLAVSLVVLLVIMFGSMAMVSIEAGQPGANIETGDDALWWSVVTVATVGYGDRFPVTGPGRLIGVVMIVMGVSLFSVFTSYIASSFVGRGDRDTKQRISAMQDQITTLHGLLMNLQQPSTAPLSSAEETVAADFLAPPVQPDPSPIHRQADPHAS